jgi:hypothetical protein
MTLHLIKLCVGIETLSDLAAWQSRRLKDKKRDGKPQELIHVTRHAPRRAAEILDGGSLYWVIKGWVSARQNLLDIRPVMKNGIAHCALVYDKELVAVEPRAHRAFQGWRYLDPKDAPPDMAIWTKGADLPDALRRELISLGLL